MKRSDMHLSGAFRYSKEIPDNLGLRLCSLSEHDLSPWIACFLSVKPQPDKSAAWQRWIKTPGELDRSARTLQNISVGLIAVLTVNNGMPLSAIETDGRGIPVQGTWKIGEDDDPAPHIAHGPLALVEDSPGGDLIPVWDLALIMALRATGPEGQAQADKLLTEAVEHGETLYQYGCGIQTHSPPKEDPWAWFNTPAAGFTWPAFTKDGKIIRLSEPFTAQAWRRLAWAIWSDQIKPNIRPTYLSMVATTGITKLLKAHAIEDNHLTDKNGHVLAELEPHAAGPITAEREALQRALRSTGQSELTRLAGPRFLLHFAERVQRRPKEEWIEPVEWAGWNEIAEQLEMEGDTKPIKALVELLVGIVLHYPEGAACSLFRGYEALQGCRTRSGYVRLTPGAPWLGERDPFMRDLKDRGAHNRSLVPLVPLPAPVGHRDHAAQARLFLGGLLPALADGNTDLASGNGVHLPLQWWREQATQWNVPGPLIIDRLRQAWTAEDGPLEKVGDDRYHLSEKYTLERELLECGGKIRLRASKGGKSAVAKKRRK